MKIALQITTATLGDMVIEEADEKTTTNVEDQKAIVVELLVRALSKVTAAYKIPKEMLDMGDDDYVDAHARKVEQDKQPRYSSAEQNRNSHVEKLAAEDQYDKNMCRDGVCNCPPENENSDEDEDLDLSEEEYAVIQQIVRLMKGIN